MEETTTSATGDDSSFSDDDRGRIYERYRRARLRYERLDAEADPETSPLGPADRKEAEDQLPEAKKEYEDAFLAFRRARGDFPELSDESPDAVQPPRSETREQRAELLRKEIAHERMFRRKKFFGVVAERNGITPERLRQLTRPPTRRKDTRGTVLVFSAAGAIDAMPTISMFYGTLK